MMNLRICVAAQIWGRRQPGPLALASSRDVGPGVADVRDCEGSKSSAERSRSTRRPNACGRSSATSPPTRNGIRSSAGSAASFARARSSKCASSRRRHVRRRSSPPSAPSNPDRELRWLGRLLVPGIFDGEHSLSIEPLESNGSRFVQSERFSGILVGLVKGTLQKTDTGFEQMNAALKERIEQRAHPAEPAADTTN
jgi:hypothetical protein